MTKRVKEPGSTATSAVIRVGDGRGFVIIAQHRIKRRYVVSRRLVITAAHCLPLLPPCVSAAPPEVKTYPKLLAALGGEPAVSCECLFVDPVADIAVLGAPDNQAFFEGQDDAYDELVGSDSVRPLKIVNPDKEGWLLSLDGVWFRCAVQRATSHGPLWLTDLSGQFIGGMSGSPIVSAEGGAIGVACVGTEGVSENPLGPEPSLVGNLPGWLLAET